MKNPLIFENHIVRYEFINGVLKATFKSSPITLEDAKSIVKVRLDFSKGQSFPSMVTDVGVKSIGHEAREYLSSDEALTGLSATALVAKNVFAKHLANFFLRINVIKPKIPTKIFSNESDAIEWLKVYK